MKINDKEIAQQISLDFATLLNRFFYIQSTRRGVQRNREMSFLTG